MGNVNSFKPGATQGAGLNSRCRGEFSGRHRYSGNAQIFEVDGVVQTARGARPSIGQAFDHSIHSAQLIDHLRRSVLGESWLACAENIGHVPALAQDRLQAIEEEAAAGLADVEQSNLLAGQRLQARRWHCRLRRTLNTGMDKSDGHEETSFISQE